MRPRKTFGVLAFVLVTRDPDWHGEHKVLSVMFLGPFSFAVEWHLRQELALKQEDGIGAVEKMLVRGGHVLGAGGRGVTEVCFEGTDDTV